MMRNIFTLFCMVLLVLVSCNKMEFEPDYSNGKATAIKDGELWIGKGRGTINNHGKGIDMYYDVFDNIGQLRERLSFRSIPYTTGTYHVLNGANYDVEIVGSTFFLLGSDGDVIQAVYRVVESEIGNTITVHDYDATTRLLTGEFSVKYMFDPNRPKTNPNNPDTVNFIVGQFEVKIEE